MGGLDYIAEPLRHMAVPIGELTFDPANARLHDEANMSSIKGSLRQFGQRQPLIVQRQGMIVRAGNGRLKAAIELGWTHVAVLIVDEDNVSAVAFAISDNRTAELAEWDDAVLERLLHEVEVGDPDLQQMMADLAQDQGLLFGDDGGDETEEAPEAEIDRAEELREKWGTAAAQLWLIHGKTGTHRLLCGDSTKGEDVARLMDGQRANLCFTSPPYASQRKYDESSGFKPIPPDEYVAWWEPIQACVKAHLAVDGSFFVNIKPCADGLDTHLYVFDLVIAHVRRWGWHFATEFCWERTGVPKGVTRRFKNQFEPVYQFTLGEWKMRPEAVRHASNDVPMSLGKGSGNTGWADRQGSGGVIPSNRRPRRAGKTSTKSLDQMQGTGCAVGDVVVNGMAFPGNRLPPFTGSHEATGHTAAFPVGLPSFFIKAYTDEGDRVYEPFCGSGSTLIAAEQLGRTCYGMEISPAYVGVILERCEQAGMRPELEGA